MAGGPIRLPIVSKFDDKGIRQAEKSLTNFGKNAGIALGAATAAVGAFAVMSVKAFAEFDAEMTKSLAIMGDVSDTLRSDMAQAAREVAKETTFSANQAAESFFFLASAGLDATQSIAALPQVSKFAQAGMFDMALATDLLTDAQSALGLTVDDATANLTNLTRVSDVLVKANTLANASVEQFSKALTTKAGAALRSLGKEVEEGVAVLAAFADQGIKGEIAGTQLSIVLRDLTTKAIDNRREFDRYNVSVFDSAGEMRNMADIVGDLEGALDGMSDETAKATLLQMGFSDKSLASLMALMGTSEAIREYEQSLKDAGGTTDEVSGKQLETFNAQLDLLKSRFTDVMLTVGEGLTPTLMTFAEEMGPLIDELAPALIGLFEEMAPVIEELFTQLPGFIEALIPLIPVVGDLATLVLGMAQAIMPVLSGVIEEIAPIMEGFSGVLAENGEIFGALILSGALFIGILKVMSTWLGVTGGAGLTAAAGQKGFLGVVFSGLGIIAAAIAALVGISYALFHVDDSVKTSGGFITGFYETWAAVTYGIQWLTKSLADAIVYTFEHAINLVVDGLNAVGGAIAALGGKQYNALSRVDFRSLVPDITPLEDYRRELGLIESDLGKFSGMTFPQRDVSGISDMVTRQNRDAIGRYRAAEAVRQLNMPGFMGGMSGFTDQGLEPGFFDYNGMTQFRSGQGADQRKYEITVNAGMGTDPTQLGDEIYSILLQYDRYAAPVFQSARQ